MSIRILYVLFFVFLNLVGFSQKRSGKVFTAEGDDAVFTKEWALGLRFHTNGYSAFFEHTWIRDIKRKKILQASFFIYQDFRERKIKPQSTQPIFSQRPKAFKYFYGKINNFYALSVLYGNGRVLADKLGGSGVRLTLNYMGGFTLGFLKPYYLKFREQEGSNFIYYQARYQEENKLDFLDSNPATTKIFGAGSFGKGFNRMQYLPGVQAKIGLDFDFARKSSLITSLEVGAQIDVFYKKVKTYASKNNKPYILNIYLALKIGKRN